MMSDMKTLRLVLACAIATSIGCTSSDSDEALKLFPVDATGGGLQISQPEYRFGTSEVGNATVETFVIANRGADRYPLNSLAVAGRDAPEFIVGDDSLVLEPGDSYQFDVSFRPQSAGQKLATLQIDYDVIAGDTAASVATEAVYYQAKELEQSDDLVAAAGEYRRYVNGVSTDANKGRAMARLPLLDEADVYGTDQGFDTYRNAMDEREQGRFDIAIELLKTVALVYPDGYLADDAQYMIGYIQVADLGDYPSGLESLETLLRQYPQTSYADTAMYSQAIAFDGLGDRQAARETIEALRQRHTAMSLGDDAFHWPKDNFVSRMWFEKSSAMLQQLSAAG